MTHYTSPEQKVNSFRIEVKWVLRFVAVILTGAVSLGTYMYKEQMMINQMVLNHQGSLDAVERTASITAATLAQHLLQQPQNSNEQAQIALKFFNQLAKKPDEITVPK